MSSPRRLETRLGLPRRIGVALALAEDPEHPPHVGERLPARPVDGLEGGAGLRRTLVERGQPGAGLDDDHAHMVRHDVVQLAGDPVALVLDRATVSFVAVGLEDPGALLDRGLVPAARPHPVAERPDDRDRDERRDESREGGRRADLREGQGRERGRHDRGPT